METTQQIPKPQWKRTLTTERDPFHPNAERAAHERCELGITSYKSFLSLGTERRARLTLDGENFIDINVDDKGYVNVEVMRIESYGINVVVRGTPDDTKDDFKIYGEGTDHIQITVG